MPKRIKMPVYMTIRDDVWDIDQTVGANGMFPNRDDVWVVQILLRESLLYLGKPPVNFIWGYSSDDTFRNALRDLESCLSNHSCHVEDFLKGASFSELKPINYQPHLEGMVFKYKPLLVMNYLTLLQRQKSNANSMDEYLFNKYPDSIYLFR